jgi:PAS domain S-box-containing protein
MKGSSKEYFLEKIFDSSLDAIIITDINGYITEANNAFMKLVGYNKKEVIGKHMVEFSPMKERAYESTTGELIHLDKKFHDDIKSKMASFIEKGNLSNSIGYQLRKDGKIVPVEDNMVFLFDSKGEKNGAFAIIRDITERKKEEREIQRTNDYLENIFRTSVDGIIIGDAEGKIAAVNKAAERIFGSSSDQLVGKHTAEMEYSEEKFQIPGTELIERLLSYGTITEVERTMKKPDGTTVVVEMNIALLKDDEGNMTGSVASIRDITDRKKAEKALKASEEKYYNLIENANDAIISTKLKGKIVGIKKKAEKMFGYSREEILGKSNELLVAKQSRGEQKEEEKKLEEIGGGYDSGQRILEWTCVRKNGEEFPVEFTFYSIEVGGEVIANSIVRDVSKRKKEEKKLINYQKKLKDLTTELVLAEQKERQYFADFLHDEIGQQLFATRLQLELLKNSISSTENTKTLDNALNTLHQVMSQTRSLTTELSSPILKQLGLEKALEWLAEETYKKYDILVTFEDDKQEKPLEYNTQLLLYQAVSELLTNVAKHAQTKNASVSIKKYNSSVQICVGDNGAGFYPPTDKSSHATIEGIGLFRIKERMEPLGGQLEIESQPNRGTKVTLVAPLDDNFQEQKT